MDAKEKEIQLFNEHLDVCYGELSDTGDGVEVKMLAKESALITVNNIIDDYKYISRFNGIDEAVIKLRVEYWRNVLNGINDI